jgi:hypothetical protein
MTLRASPSSLTPLTLEGVAAIAFVAVVVLLVGAMLYLVLAGSVAWALMLLQGLVWLVYQGLRRSRIALHGHIRRVAPAASGIAAEAAPDVVLRPSH